DDEDRAAVRPARGGAVDSALRDETARRPRDAVQGGGNGHHIRAVEITIVGFGDDLAPRRVQKRIFPCEGAVVRFDAEVLFVGVSVANAVHRRVEVVTGGYGRGAHYRAGNRADESGGSGERVDAIRIHEGAGGDAVRDGAGVKLPGARPEIDAD